MSRTNVDLYFQRAKQWRGEMERLRKILLDCGLTEELKWGKPFYRLETGNVAVIWAFKDHCALGFCKGALLKDPRQILVKPGEHTQAVRKIPFTSIPEIVKLKSVLKSYLQEAIDVEKAGLEVTYKTTAEFETPRELQDKMARMPALKKAFAALTPGRQRGYLLHFSAPTQSKTRESRIEKQVEQILNGRGLHDDYRAMRNKKAEAPGPRRREGVTSSPSPRARPSPPSAA